MATTSIIKPTNLTKQYFSSLENNSKSKDKQEIKYILKELDSIRQVRIRSLSHWPHLTPSSESMATSGWFSCNVNDRVICIYCHTICHQWTANDDPTEVHTRLAPQCPFVLSMSPTERSPKMMNDNILQKFEPAHPKLAELSRRQQTFTTTWTTENSPSIDDLVRAGFFFSGISNTVTCFYCNGSLHKWGSNDNPMIEHARWFPNCMYAKHLCGNNLYEKIQISKKQSITTNKINSDDLNRLVAARLDLPIVQRLRSQYKLSVIKRCFEDQLKLKNDDFQTDLDLTMACSILQKQIDHIQGCKDRIIIPSANQQTKTSSEISKQSLGECLICLADEKQLACIPCGHLCACVPCGYSLHTCPICRENIQSFMRINS